MIIDKVYELNMGDYCDFGATCGETVTLWTYNKRARLVQGNQIMKRGGNPVRATKVHRGPQGKVMRIFTFKPIRRYCWLEKK